MNLRSIQNIFLDFLNRDSREIYGLFAANPQVHEDLLTETINIAILLCGEFCICPPGFLAECDVARRAVERRKDLLHHRLIRFPIRESTIDELLDKKHREYSSFMDRYMGLYDDSALAFLRNSPQAIISRETVIASQLVHDWERGPDEVAFWHGLTKIFKSKEIDLLRDIPRELKNEGLAVTWSAIQDRIGKQLSIDARLFRRALQHQYFTLYLKEFNAVVLKNTQFGRIDFGLQNASGTYDCEIFRSVCRSAGVWEILLNLSGPSLVGLRENAEYVRFRQLFDQFGETYMRVDEARFISASAAENIGSNPSNRLIETLQDQSKCAPPTGLEINQISIEVIAERLSEVANKAVAASAELGSTLHSPASLPINLPRPSINISTMNKKSSLTKQVAVFVALREERDALIKRWNLTRTSNQHYSKGTVGGAELFLYCSKAMGRVAAAIETFDFLSRFEGSPDLLICTGIAGGIQENNVDCGTVLIPSQVFDLAQRKIQDVDQELRTAFRQQPYSTDTSLVKFVDDGDFDVSAWSMESIKEEEWPEGRRPVLSFDPIASVDEVVASDEWRKRLLSTHPKLAGIEMEAGGVCAAAERFDKKVVVVRGVSDRADPVKSDTFWRRVALGTAARLIESFLSSKNFTES